MNEHLEHLEPSLANRYTMRWRTRRVAQITGRRFLGGDGNLWFVWFGDEGAVVGPEPVLTRRTLKRPLGAARLVLKDMRSASLGTRWRRAPPSPAFKVGTEDDGSV